MCAVNIYSYFCSTNKYLYLDALYIIFMCVCQTNCMMVLTFVDNIRENIVCELPHSFIVGLLHFLNLMFSAS